MASKLIATCDQAISFEVSNEVTDGVIRLTANGYLSDKNLGIHAIGVRVDSKTIADDINDCRWCFDRGGIENCRFNI